MFKKIMIMKYRMKKKKITSRCVMKILRDTQNAAFWGSAV